MKLRTYNFRCNECGRESAFKAAVATTQATVQMDGFLCSHYHTAGTPIRNTKLVSFTDEPYNVTGSLGYDAALISSHGRVAPKPDTKQWQREFNRAAKEIEDARPKPTKEESEMLKRAMTRHMRRYSIPGQDGARR